MGSKFSAWTVAGAWRVCVAGLLVVSGLSGCGDFETAVAGAGAAPAELVLPERSQDLKRVGAAKQAPRTDFRRIDQQGDRGSKPSQDKPLGARPLSEGQRIAQFEAAGGSHRADGPGGSGDGDWSGDGGRSGEEDREAWAGRDRLPDDFADGPEANPEQFGGEARRDAPLPEDCPVCGRETGFLGAPVLTGVVSADKSVLLTWEAVDGAEYYLVRALAAGYDDLDRLPSEFQWRTNLTGLSLNLPENQHYSFTVEARRERPKARSVRSNSVVIEL